ncbi:transposase [Streptomyces sp. NPDC006990]|uniref:transposase n=1 Tax=unclassified Streptomyces TaxID=2593676 RepID=UPI0034566B92
MTDAEWAVVRAGMPVPGWLEGRGGQPKSYCHRQMIDAVRYLVDNGIKWRAMPSDFPVGLVTGCRFGFVRGGCRRGLARSSRCAAKWPELPSAAGIKSVAPSRYEIYSELFASKVTMNPGHPVGDVLAFGAVFAAQTRT